MLSFSPPPLQMYTLMHIHAWPHPSPHALIITSRMNLKTPWPGGRASPLGATTPDSQPQCSLPPPTTSLTVLNFYPFLCSMTRFPRVRDTFVATGLEGPPELVAVNLSL